MERDGTFGNVPVAKTARTVLPPHSRFFPPSSIHCNTNNMSKSVTVSDELLIWVTSNPYKVL